MGPEIPVRVDLTDGKPTPQPRYTESRGWIDKETMLGFTAALAMFITGLGNVLNLSGFVLAFVGGVAFGWDKWVLSAPGSPIGVGKRMLTDLVLFFALLGITVVLVPSVFGRLISGDLVGHSVICGLGLAFGDGLGSCGGWLLVAWIGSTWNCLRRRFGCSRWWFGIARSLARSLARLAGSLRDFRTFRSFGLLCFALRGSSAPFFRPIGRKQTPVPFDFDRSLDSPWLSSLAWVPLDSSLRAHFPAWPLESLIPCLELSTDP